MLLEWSKSNDNLVNKVNGITAKSTYTQYYYIKRFTLDDGKDIFNNSLSTLIIYLLVLWILSYVFNKKFNTNFNILNFVTKQIKSIGHFIVSSILLIISIMGGLIAFTPYIKNIPKDIGYTSLFRFLLYSLPILLLVMALLAVNIPKNEIH